nr:MAG TPA: hypothetical protein [Caudoviricetes sp.]
MQQYTVLFELAYASHAGGHWFESSSLHQKSLETQRFQGFSFLFISYLLVTC